MVTCKKFCNKAGNSGPLYPDTSPLLSCLNSSVVNSKFRVGSALMAELLGTIASAISVAEVEVGLKVCGNFLKLKRLWSEAKEVPEIISDLMAETELLILLLGGFESEGIIMALILGGVSAKLGISYCQAALII